MPKYNYVAMDSHGKETKGTLEVASQNEAIGRVKEMGLFPTKIVEIEKIKEKTDKKAKPAGKAAGKKGGALNFQIKIPGLSGRVKSKVLTTFTRQLATLSLQHFLPQQRPNLVPDVAERWKGSHVFGLAVQFLGHVDHLLDASGA